MEPLGDKPAVLVKDLNTVVLTVTNKQPALGVESESVDHIEFSWAHAFLSPSLDEFPVLIELHDSGVVCSRATPVVSVANENIAVWSDRDIGRGIELVQTRSSDSLSAECQQHLPILIELEDLVSPIVG